jgi:hypothetical protein
MKPFPKQFELISFFESEPEVTDKGLSWHYNHLRFRYEKSEDVIECDIEPASGILDIQWTQAGKVRSVFNLRNVSSLRVEDKDGEERLIASFLGQKMEDFTLWTKPHVHVQWGMSEF